MPKDNRRANKARRIKKHVSQKNTRRGRHYDSRVPLKIDEVVFLGEQAIASVSPPRTNAWLPGKTMQEREEVASKLLAHQLINW